MRFVAKKGRDVFWEFVCDCGGKIITSLCNVTTGHTKSCGCLAKEISTKTVKRVREKRYPNSKEEYRKELYKIRSDFIYRSKNTDIAICPEWLDKNKGLDNFYYWAISAGYKKGDFIVRRDCNKGFCPENCYFGDRKDLCNSRKTNKKFTINGVTKNMFQWAEIYHISPQTVSGRLRRGLSIEQALKRLEE